MKRMLAAALALTALCIPATGRAYYEFPDRPVRMIVGTTPGESSDILARLLAQPLSRYFGKPALVENFSGRMGHVAAVRVAKSPPDGHTLLVVSPSFATHVSLYPDLGYHPQRDFAPVARIATFHHVLIASPALETRTLPDFLARVRANPGRIAIASAGTGTPSHLVAELLKIRAGWLNALHVPYRGSGHAVADVLGGHVQAAVSSVASAQAHVRIGRLRALAVTSESRLPVLPHVPTLAESGFPNVVGYGWSGVVAPAGTPYDTIVRVSVALGESLKSKTVRQRFAALGADVTHEPHEKFAEFLRAEIAKWEMVVKAAGVNE